VRRGCCGGRKKDSERAGRILHEEVAIRDVAVQEEFGVALVEVDVPEASGAEQPAVRDGAGPDVDRNADETGAHRVPCGGAPSGQEAEPAAARAVGD